MANIALGDLGSSCPSFCRIPSTTRGMAGEDQECLPQLTCSMGQSLPRCSGPWGLGPAGERDHHARGDAIPSTISRMHAMEQFSNDVALALVNAEGVASSPARCFDVASANGMMH